MECATLKDFGSMSTKEILEANAKGQTMTISMDKQYRTRCGFEVRIYAVDSGGLYPIHGAYLFDGVWVACTWEKEGGCLGSSPLDLIEVKPRIQREYWVNVFKNHLEGWKEKETADRRRHNRIACVKITVDCEEGEGEEL